MSDLADVSSSVANSTRADSLGEAPAAGDVVPDGTSKAKILVVDDEPKSLYACRSCFPRSTRT